MSKQQLAEDDGQPAQQEEGAPDPTNDTAETAATIETPAVEVRIHPAAAEGELPALPDGADPEYYIGLWGKTPLYGCPYCTYSSIQGSGAVEFHILAKLDTGDLAHRKALELKG